MSQSNLRIYVEQAAAKYRADLKTSTDLSACPKCGGKLQKDGKLLTMCERRHIMDVDVAASLFALKRIPDATSIAAEPLAIPAHLCRYLRVMASGEIGIRVAGAN